MYTTTNQKEDNNYKVDSRQIAEKLGLRHDSRQIAEKLGLRHDSLVNRILKYRHKFEQLGQLYLKSEDNFEKFLLFTEDQIKFIRINLPLFLI